MEVNTLIGFGGVLIGAAGLTFAMMTMVRHLKRQAEYDERRHRAQLDEMRAYFERQLYETNAKLMATEARWVDVNHLVLSSQNRSDQTTSSSLSASQFLRGAGVPEDTQIDPKLVFVLTPFNDLYEDTFDVIRRSCEQVGMKAVRGDEDHIVGELFPHIINLIASARLIVANLDGRNPNVFYELGIAQTLGKSVIAISSIPDDVPFDLRTKRFVTYSDLATLARILPDAIAKALVSERA